VVEKTIQVTERWYVETLSSGTDERTRVLKHGETFGVFDLFGDLRVLGKGEQGVYHQGTRFLSRWELQINGQRLMLLNSMARRDNSVLVVDLTTPDLYEAGKQKILKGTVHVFRSKLLLEAACCEQVHVHNYGDRPVHLEITFDFDADYADIFEVRGVRRAAHGIRLQPTISRNTVIARYHGLDDVERSTSLSFDPEPASLTAKQASYILSLPPKERVNLSVTMMFEPRVVRDRPSSYADAMVIIDSELNERASSCVIHTSNGQFNEWLTRSAADLMMLTMDNPEGAYPYAGVPWYSAPFGRDGILTAMQYLWMDPGMARGVLAFLAQTQATQVNPERDAEPGKIIHEMRKGELAALGEIPFDRYYGSVDATPLFVVLAGAYYRRTNDLAFLRSVWPNVERALAWIDRYGDADGDGFVEYRRHSSNGLANQGWKDSHDAISHGDGRLAKEPVALAEVQGYVYLAKLYAADIAQALGEERLAMVLRTEAGELRERFELAFWNEELQTYNIALDGTKKPCNVRSSNAGQVLWSGIAYPEHARRAAETLFSPASFSGWGIRTLAQGEVRYNPMSYHNGSVWPHDNAIIAGGLARYDMQDKAAILLGALFEASLFMDLHRLPELFCGFVRRGGEGPTAYPVACSPQAWASACPFSLLQACLGLSFHFEEPRIRFEHPILPYFLQRVEIFNLQVGQAHLDLALERHKNDVGINVLRKEGDVEVSVVL
jgi:glycogen debranching enzyme